MRVVVAVNLHDPFDSLRAFSEVVGPEGDIKKALEEYYGGTWVAITVPLDEGLEFGGNDA